MRSVIIILSIIAACILAGSYFYFRTSSTAIETTPVAIQHVSLYHYFSGALSGGMEETIDSINADSEKEKILANALDHEAFKSLILSNLAKGDPPEIFTYWAGVKTQDLVNQGYLEPLDDIWETHGLDDRLSESLTQTASIYNGRKYFIPLDRHIVVFFYNTALFQDLGLKVPQTYGELIHAATTLKDAGVTPFSLGALERWPAQFWFDYLLLRTAGRPFRQSLLEGQASYLDPPVVAAYQKWSTLLLQGFFNANANDIDWAAAARMVCTGEAAMTLMGTWAIQHFTDAPCNLRQDADFDFFPFPLIDEEVEYTSLGPVDGLVVAKGSANRETAKKLLPRFLDRQPQQLFSKGSGAFATSEDVPESAYSPFKRRLFQIIKQSQSWAFNYDLAVSPAIADFTMDSFNELIAFPDQYEAILDNLDSQIRGHTEPLP